MNEDKKLISYGSIYGENFGTGFAGNTWGVEGLCPTLKCESGGGNRVPLIVIGSTQRNAFIGDCSYCPTLTEAMGCGGGQIPMIVEKVWSCASRGRDPENPSDRRPGINLEQRLEINHDGICNCITSVAKDSYVLEKCVVSENGSDRGSKETPEGL